MMELFIQPIPYVRVPNDITYYHSSQFVTSSTLARRVTKKVLRTWAYNETALAKNEAWHLKEHRAGAVNVIQQMFMREVNKSLLFSLTP